MKNILFQFLFFLKTIGGFGQQLPPQQVTLLSPELEENSGMVVLGADSILFVNDSGNPPILYLSDTLGNILKAVYVADFPNNDWEELAYDGIDRLFIGDFGNNSNTRTDLSIASVSLTQVLQQDTVRSLTQMHISYQRQQNFPPPANARHYDMEAMVFAQDSLYLFSKNRTVPFDGKVYQYSVPNVSGSYMLEPRDSFVTGNGLMASYWVTAAAYRGAKRELLLLGYDKLWRFNQSGPPFFFSGSVASVYSFNNFSQKESIEYVGDSIVYLSDEASVSGPQRLYVLQLPSQGIGLTEATPQPYSLSVEQHWVKDSINLQFTTSVEASVVFEVFSVTGERVLFGKLGKYNSGTFPLFIDASKLKAGGYVLNVLVNGKPNAFKLRKAYTFKN